VASFSGMLLSCSWERVPCPRSSMANVKLTRESRGMSAVARANPSSAESGFAVCAPSPPLGWTRVNVDSPPASTVEPASHGGHMKRHTHATKSAQVPGLGSCVRGYSVKNKLAYFPLNWGISRPFSPNRLMKLEKSLRTVSTWEHTDSQKFKPIRRVGFWLMVFSKP
jgi:hypothetical protein